MNKITTHVSTLDSSRLETLRAVLESKSWVFQPLANALWKASAPGVNVSAYKSGKIVVQGAATEEFVLFTLEPDVTGKPILGYENVPQADGGGFKPHAGIDESGKGDFFGPLVVACAFVPDAETARRLREAGARDSKSIGSDPAIAAIAAKAKGILGESRWSLVVVGPEAYNKLYAKFANLNKLLAWGHARALENILEKSPECPSALSDKFGHESLVARALMEKGRQIELQQRTKAESDIAVATASVIARAEFVRRMDLLSKDAGVTLPKGAGPGVLRTARALVAAHGAEILARFAKTHFKTAAEAVEPRLPSF